MWKYSWSNKLGASALRHYLCHHNMGLLEFRCQVGIRNCRLHYRRLSRCRDQRFEEYVNLWCKYLHLFWYKSLDIICSRTVFVLISFFWSLREKEVVHLLLNKSFFWILFQLYLKPHLHKINGTQWISLFDNSLPPISNTHMRVVWY